MNGYSHTIVQIESFGIAINANDIWTSYSSFILFINVWFPSYIAWNSSRLKFKSTFIQFNSFNCISSAVPLSSSSSLFSPFSTVGFCGDICCGSNAEDHCVGFLWIFQRRMESFRFHNHRLWPNRNGCRRCPRNVGASVTSIGEHNILFLLAFVPQ